MSPDIFTTASPSDRLTPETIISAINRLGPQTPAFQYIVSDQITTEGDPVQVPRTWRERLFSRPWRPLQPTRTVIPRVPHPGAVRAGNVIFMHPQTFEKIKALPSYEQPPLGIPIFHDPQIPPG